MHVTGSASVFAGGASLNGGAAEEESSGTTSKRERKINVRQPVRCKVKSKEPGRATQPSSFSLERVEAWSIPLSASSLQGMPTPLCSPAGDQEKTITRTTVHFRDLAESEYNYRALPPGTRPLPW
ncbi:uncharacterized protein LOC122532548 [Frieseomelitta varia]|uniref:uncharacterized protein LOC122532548 n=1 Tax=Frieseomelitta varia TaxID=561572 RepID=UPI001CB689D7|nr:uncharacterized protein LOC122532548 [Frieseomelitta varia]